MLEEMWKSVTNHIQDIHDGHSELYPECVHGPLDEDERDKEIRSGCSLVSYYMSMHVISSIANTIL